MRRYHSLFVLFTAVLPFSLLAADSSSPAKQDLAASSAGVKFHPPNRGSASVRVSGGSRGSGDSTITLDVLAPDDIGITTQEQPSLFWYQSKPAAAKFELTLLEDNKPKPILQVGVERSTRAGIQR